MLYYSKKLPFTVLSICGLTYAQSLSLHGSCTIPAHGFEMALYDDYAYIITDSGLAIIDVFNDKYPELKNIAALGAHGSDIDIRNDYAYIPWNGELLIIDLSQPESPDLAARVVDDASSPYSNIGFGVTCSPENGIRHPLVCTATWASMNIIDIKNPRSPEFLCRYIPYEQGYVFMDSSSEKVDDIAFSTSNPDNVYILYLEYGYLKLQKLNVSSPQKPVLIEKADLFFCGCALAAFGDYAYVAHGSGLDVIYTAGDTMTVVSSVEITGAVVDMCIYDNYVFLSYWYEGIRVVDISDPLYPSLVHSQPVTGNAQGISFKPPFLYISTRNEGLKIFEFTHSNKVRYPFLKSTLVPSSDKNNTFRIYDLQGKLIGYSACQGIEKNTIPFINLSAGIYVYVKT